MKDIGLERRIRAKALSLGYEKCGIVRVSDMAGYAEKLARRIEEYPHDRPLLERFSGFADPGKAHAWARSVIVLVREYGKYRIPPSIKDHFASAYLSSLGHVEGSPEFKDSVAFSGFLVECGIRAETDRKTGVTAMRWAAMRAGLGVIRKNNFFYTESGSWVLLSTWLIDKELELKEKYALKPCSKHCRNCIDSCPTAALREPYSVRPTACISFLTGFGGDALQDNPASPAMGARLYGCDACQSACPFNALPGRETIDYPGLDAFAAEVSLTSIIDMDYETLRERFAEKFWYISGDRLWKWKVNALNAMKNGYKAEYLPWIEKACFDPIEHVRSMAEWVLRSIEKAQAERG